MPPLHALTCRRFMPLHAVTFAVTCPHAASVRGLVDGGDGGEARAARGDSAWRARSACPCTSRCPETAVRPYRCKALRMYRCKAVYEGVQMHQGCRALGHAPSHAPQAALRAPVLAGPAGGGPAHRHSASAYRIERADGGATHLSGGCRESRPCSRCRLREGVGATDDQEQSLAAVTDRVYQHLLTAAAL
jgi:hypothetical protein